jgi:ubiquinone/menaquinone biosynthesis C-methylase UbiE
LSADRGLLFDRIAEAYDRARPSYPDELVDRACERAGLGEGSPVVEVGCGTGKLTVALAARGLRVEAVDPGANLVEVARRLVGEAPVRFHVARFEDVDLPAGAFEAIFSATAFHWVDPDVAWSKAAQLLRPGGALALLTHVGGSLLDLQREVLAAWREVHPQAASWYFPDERTLWEGAEARRENVSAVWAWFEKSEKARPEAAELFQHVEIAKVRIEHRETASELIEHLQTTSTYLGLDAAAQKTFDDRTAAAVEKAGGVCRSVSFATLVTAQVRP